ncbi:hypothetical protein ACSMFQ_18805 [Ectopseudomonas chengduensis]
MSNEQIEKAKEHGAIAVLAILENADLSQRLMLARAMRRDVHLSYLVEKAAGYIMGGRHREAAFWKMLAIRLGEPRRVNEGYLAELKRLRRAEKRSVGKTYFGLPVYSCNGTKCVSRDDIKNLPFFDFWEESATGSTCPVDGGVVYVYLRDWIAFADIFIKTGRHRFQ